MLERLVCQVPGLYAAKNISGLETIGLRRAAREACFVQQPSYRELNIVRRKLRVTQRRSSSNMADQMGIWAEFLEPGSYNCLLQHTWSMIYSARNIYSLLGRADPSTK